MNDPIKSSDEELAREACGGDENAAAILFERHRRQLRRMVQLRMDRRLRGRVDESDVLQEAFIDFAGKVRDRDPDQMPLHLWLRLITGERLLQIHRRHLDVQARAVGQEVSLHHGPMPEASSISLAENLLGKHTSPSLRAVRGEIRDRVQELLNSMDPTDREVLVLRHFEDLRNEDVAKLLGLKASAASNRYLRALERLRVVLSQSGLV